ncbi:MAG: hypothetical protein ACXV98_14500, partial [Ilumatobacteraceae bacterium]
MSTFLLLSASLVVSLPGLMNASATSGSHSSGDGSGDGGSGDGHNSCKSGGDDNGSDDSGDDTSGDDSSGDGSSSDYSTTSSDDSGVSSDSQGIAGTNTNGSDNSGHNGNDGGKDGGGDDGKDGGGGDGHGGHGGHGGRKCFATLTLNKVVINDNDGTATIADFTLTATSSTGGVKVINGVDPNPSTHIGLTAKVPVTDTYVLSETNIDGYDASGWECSAGTLAGDTLTLAAGDAANCTITNNDTPPPPKPTTITVDKLLPGNQWGGTLTPADFQLKIDGNNAAQGVAISVRPGSHTISELNRPGYQPAGINCVDLATTTSTELVDGSLTVAEGQNFHCFVANEAIAPMLTLTKTVINDNGANLVASDFQLKIDGNNAAQGVAISVRPGSHT